MSLPNPTLENLVVALRLSNKPNIVVEGKDDEIIYRRLVERLGRFGIGCFSTGSKNTLLHLYEELSQYESQGILGMSLSLLSPTATCGCSQVFLRAMQILFGHKAIVLKMIYTSVLNSKVSLKLISMKLISKP